MIFHLESKARGSAFRLLGNPTYNIIHRKVFDTDITDGSDKYKMYYSVLGFLVFFHGLGKRSYRIWTLHRESATPEIFCKFFRNTLYCNRLRFIIRIVIF